MIYINGLSNELAKIDAPAWCSRYAAFPVSLLLLEQHVLGAQDFKSEGITLFYLTINAIPKPHHSSTQLSPLVIFVSPTLTKLCIPGKQSHTDKHLQALGCDAGDLGAILGSATCFGLDFDPPLPMGDLGPAVLPAHLPLASPCA